MVLIGISDTLSLAQSIGIVGTMVLTLYFSKRQIHALSIDQETRVLNDLDEKFHNMAMLAMEDPSIVRVVDMHEYTNKKEVAFAFYILWTCAHAFAMRQRRVLDDNKHRFVNEQNPENENSHPLVVAAQSSFLKHGSMCVYLNYLNATA
jgi:hypothetical protein